MHLKDSSDVSIEHVQNDFFVYLSADVNLDEFRHVIEIYDFPAVFKTDDLLDAFAKYRFNLRNSFKSFLIFARSSHRSHVFPSIFSNGGMKIKWVDDTHALGVFASESAGMRRCATVHVLFVE